MIHTSKAFQEIKKQLSNIEYKELNVVEGSKKTECEGPERKKRASDLGKIQLRVPPLITHQTHLVGKLFVINAQLNSDMLAPKSPARYQIGPRSWPTLANPLELPR